jgi:anhydro-N-acetylmuramic acid kinase
MHLPERFLPDLRRPWRVMGLMSGTSADGVDVVMIEVDAKAFQGALENSRPFRTLLAHHHEPYDDALRHDVIEAVSDRMVPSQLCALQRRLGEQHAAAAKKLCAELGQPDLASLHGQTVQHHPQIGASLQLADPYVLAESIACPVVWDLRRRDLALGGQGAPLVPLTELWLRGKSEPWLALNLGGIANLCVWDGHALQAWDLGPGMSLLDLAARRWLHQAFDPGGANAKGSVHESLIARWMTHSYFSQKPPKSTGRETFGEAWLAKESSALEGIAPGDRFATLAAFSAEAMKHESARVSLPAKTKAFISGGGAKHQRLRHELNARVPQFHFSDDDQLPIGSREAVSWALLGAASACGVPGNLPGVTGAARPAVLGSWVWP